MPTKQAPKKIFKQNTTTPVKQNTQAPGKHNMQAPVTKIVQRDDRATPKMAAKPRTGSKAAAPVVVVPVAAVTRPRSASKKKA